jgi:hypothetical protein
VQDATALDEPTAETAAPGQTTGDDQYGQHAPDLQRWRQPEQQPGHDVVRSAQPVVGPERSGDHQREQQDSGSRRFQQNRVLDVDGAEEHRIHQAGHHGGQSPQWKQHQPAQDRVQATEGHPTQSSHHHRVWLPDQLSQPRERGDQQRNTWRV